MSSLTPPASQRHGRGRAAPGREGPRAKPARCNRCRRIVRWVTMLEDGRRLAVNPDPDVDLGTIALDHRGRGQRLTLTEAELLQRLTGDDVYRPHYESCPMSGREPSQHTS